MNTTRFKTFEDNRIAYEGKYTTSKGGPLLMFMGDRTEDGGAQVFVKPSKGKYLQSYVVQAKDFEIVNVNGNGIEVLTFRLRSGAGVRFIATEVA